MGQGYISAISIQNKKIEEDSVQYVCARDYARAYLGRVRPYIAAFSGLTGSSSRGQLKPGSIDKEPGSRDA